MTDSAAAMTALLQHLIKLLRGFPDHAGGLASGSSTVVFVSSDQEVVDRLPGLSKALRTLRDLGPEDRALLAAGKGRILFAPPGSSLVRRLDLDAVAGQIRQMAAADDIVRLLESDTRITVPKLRSLADSLNIDIPAKLRRKAEIQWHLARVLAEHEARRAAG